MKLGFYIKLNIPLLKLPKIISIDILPNIATLHSIERRRAMSSFGEYFKEKILPDILGLLTFVAMGACMFGFACIVPYLQRLPLFRLDTSDAGWFSICCFIYLIVFAIPLFIAGTLAMAVIAGIVKGGILFYEHVILKPVNAISVIATSLFLVWVGSLGYDVALELIEFLS